MKGKTLKLSLVTRKEAVQNNNLLSIHLKANQIISFETTNWG